MKRSATARWTGGIKDGNGSISTESGTLDSAPYSFKARFEQGTGTNPEELLAAAHAGCFSMALSKILGDQGMKPARIQTTCTITLAPDGQGGFSITESHLDLQAEVPGADPPTFQKAAEAAETGCPVSRLFKAKITLDAKLT